MHICVHVEVYLFVIFIDYLYSLFISCSFHVSFSPGILLKSRWCSHTVVFTYLLTYQHAYIRIYACTGHFTQNI